MTRLRGPVLIPVVAAALAALSCDPGPWCVTSPCTAVEIGVTINGHVSAAGPSRSAISGATVTLTRAQRVLTSTTSDIAGHYELQHGPVACNVNQVTDLVVGVAASEYARDSSHNPSQWTRIDCTTEPQTVDIALRAASAGS